MARGIWFGSVLILLLALLLSSCASPRLQLRLANSAQERGDFAHAAAIYRDLLARAPNDGRVRAALHSKLGECLFHMGQGSDALEQFDAAMQSDPTLLLPHIRMGELYVASGSPMEALQQAELVLAQDSDNIEAVTIAGAAYAALGENPAAIKFLEKALTRDPGRVSIATTLAKLYSAQNEPEAARNVLLQSAGMNPRAAAPLLALGRLEEEQGNAAAAEEAYRRAVAVDDSRETELRLAQFLARNVRVDEAADALRRADAKSSAPPTAWADFQLLTGNVADADRRYRADMPLATGADRVSVAARIIETDLQDRDVAAARVHFTSYRSFLDPATAAVLEAEIALADNDVTTALDRAQKAVTLADDSAAAHYVLGLAKQRSGELNTALEEWTTAVDKNADFLPAHLALARSALVAGAPNSAEDHVAGVVRQEPANLAALLLYARVLAAERRFPDSDAIARRAAAIAPDSPEPHIVMGEVALERNRPAAALVQYQAAILLDPHSPAALEGLVRVYHRGTITRAVLVNMERLAASEPRSAALMEIVGRLYSDHGWYADAARCLAESLKMDSTRESAHAALARALVAAGEVDAARDAAAAGTGPRAALLAGLRAQEQNDPDEAIRQFEKAVRGDKTGVAANNLAWLYAEQGRQLDRALQLAQAADGQKPHDPAVLDTLGFVHLKRREYSDAIKALREAVMLASHAKDADLAQFRQHLAEAYLRAGQPNQAANVLNHRYLASL